MSVYRLPYLWLGTVITLEVAATYAWLSGLAIAWHAMAAHGPRERA